MRDLLIALIVFGSIPFILIRPYLGLLIWSWLGYMNPYRLAYGFAYSFPWVEIIAIITIISLILSKESKKLPITPISALLFLFLVLTGITTIFAVQADSAWQAWQEFAKTMVMVFVTLIVVNNRQRMHWLVWIIVFSLGFYGVKGGLFTLLKGGNYHVYGPSRSFIADNNDLAMALCMTLPLIRYLQFQASRKAVRVAFGLVMILTGVAVLGTYSRGGMIALAVVSGVLFLKSRRRLAVVAVVVLLGFTTLHFMPARWIERMNTLQHPEKIETGETRIQSWEFAMNVAIHRPLVGGGFNVYQSDPMWERYGPEGAKPRAVHSIYFRALGEQGFPGLVLFVGLLIASWWSCAHVRKRRREVPEEKWTHDLASMLQVSLVAFAIGGAFLPMTYFDLTYQLMALCALLESYMLRQPESTAIADLQDNGTVSLTKHIHQHDALSE